MALVDYATTLSGRAPPSGSKCDLKAVLAQGVEEAWELSGAGGVALADIPGPAKGMRHLLHVRTSVMPVLPLSLCAFAYTLPQFCRPLIFRTQFCRCLGLCS